MTTAPEGPHARAFLTRNRLYSRTLVSDLILLVEDEADQRELLLELLQHEGYRAVGVGKGKEALAAVSIECPALVLADVILPDMDGRDLREEIHKTCPEPPTFVFLTGLAPTHTARISQETLRKPVDIAELLAAVARHVKRRGQEAQTSVVG